MNKPPFELQLPVVTLAHLHRVRLWSFGGKLPQSQSVGQNFIVANWESEGDNDEALWATGVECGLLEIVLRNVGTVPDVLPNPTLN